ncbi:iron uptake porin [Chamaesiphon polymorphus]|uniref:Carbohydrate porin n=1 Tax=Chamaesiphon polymorphus CCALA 037 TaxID=2107692 RepID=A0A2T1FWT5_9CYAN|nr:iron uptake porin [Chamaesiphon polymorphus]PSB49454.1 carbohydrate porin [Chamaesiphon polymorphus CCALA 037]
MNDRLSKNLISPLLIGLAVWIASICPSVANPTGEATTEQIEQATQATEVRPGDWAYQTLQALSSKYECGNTPDGKKVLSREEFATSLNGCVQSIEQLVARRRPRRSIRRRRVVPVPSIQTPPPAAPEVVTPPPEPAPVAPPEPQIEQEEAISQQDLDRLKGLVQSFSSELQAVDNRLVSVEEKLATVQRQAFSTTTKLNGEAIIAFSGYNTGRAAGLGGGGTTGNVLSDRVRLNLISSFTGKDRLRTRLESANIASFQPVTGTNMTRLGFDGDTSNNTGVSILQYSFPLGSDTTISAFAVGSRFHDDFYTFNPALASSGSGSISRFGRFNPIYRQSNNGASLSVKHKFSPEVELGLGYAVPGINAAASTAANSGVFSGSNVYFGQLNFAPAKDLNLGVAYARAYSANGSNVAGGTGSSAANGPFGASPTISNHYSFMTSYKISPGFILSGWAGFTDASRQVVAGGSASSSNYAISLAFPDFGQKGNNLAFILGIPPKLNSRSVLAAVGGAPALTASPDNSTSYHIEALYRVKLSDNISITPGILLITNPEHNSANPTEYIGTIRTTFNF